MSQKKINTNNKKEDALFDLSQLEKDIQMETIFKNMLPKLNNNFSELVAANVLLVLKLEGVIGDSLNDSDIEMINRIKDKIFSDKKMHSEFLRVVRSIKGEKI